MSSISDARLWLSDLLRQSGQDDDQLKANDLKHFSTLTENKTAIAGTSHHRRAKPTT
jgi:hypothetical protein